MVLDQSELSIDTRVDQSQLTLDTHSPDPHANSSLKQVAAVVGALAEQGVAGLCWGRGAAGE